MNVTGSDATGLRRRFVERLGLRIGSHTAEYVSRRLGAGVAFPVLAGDARTGLPVRAVVDPAVLNLTPAVAPDPV